MTESEDQKKIFQHFEQFLGFQTPLHTRLAMGLLDC